jgi:hypothetical protein
LDRKQDQQLLLGKPFLLNSVGRLI